MNLVLGLSLTSRAIRWVLVEGSTGEGPTADRGTIDLDPETFDPGALLDVLPVALDTDAVHAVGVTWSARAEGPATRLLTALAERGHGNVVAVSDREAAAQLAAGIADITEHDNVAVAVVEPDTAMLVKISPAADGGHDGAVVVEQLPRPADGADVVELPAGLIVAFDPEAWQPDAVFVVGSADDLEVLSATLEGVTAAPVFSAAEADLAMARGAALASARALAALTPAAARLPLRVGVLASLVAAASITLVASTSAAIGLSLTRDDHPAAPQAAAETPPPPPPADETVKAAKLADSLNQAMPLVAQTMVVAAPPAPAVVPQTVYQPPAAEPPAYAAPAAEQAPQAEAPAVAPPPGMAPPPVPPVYVPPPKPRLRDRIIERIPIINRFHEPKYEYPR